MICSVYCVTAEGLHKISTFCLCWRVLSNETRLYFAFMDCVQLFTRFSFKAFETHAGRLVPIHRFGTTVTWPIKSESGSTRFASLNLKDGAATHSRKSSFSIGQPNLIKKRYSHGAALNSLLCMLNSLLYDFKMVHTRLLWGGGAAAKF